MQWNKIYKDLSHKYTYYSLNKPHKAIEKYIAFLRQSNAKDVLDLGTGLGRNLIPLLAAGFKVSGIDIAQYGLKQLNELLESNNLSANLTCGDIYEKLPYKDNSFDSIISIQVLQHNFEDKILSTINEMKRVLKPGGSIFITLCGRYAKGKLRYCLIKTAKQVNSNVYIPQKGKEIGLPHFIYNKEKIKGHFRDFEIRDFWKDDLDYYAFFGVSKNE